MHRSSLLRVQWFVREFLPAQPTRKWKVLDIGSYSVNGSYRSLFPEEYFEYTGMDIESGPNVDVVVQNPYNWTEFESDTFDVVLSGQTLEHAEFFWWTVEEMTRVLRKDGILCIVVPNVLREHRYPVDCYRFYTDGMIALCRYVNLEPLHAHTNCAPEHADGRWYSNAQTDSMLVARKPYSGIARLAKREDYVFVRPDQSGLLGNLLPHREKNPIVRLLRKFLDKRDYKMQKLN
jgi:SAM-dependent methyltransferase